MSDTKSVEIDTKSAEIASESAEIDSKSAEMDTESAEIESKSAEIEPDRPQICPKVKFASYGSDFDETFSTSSPRWEDHDFDHPRGLGSLPEALIWEVGGSGVSP